MIKFILKKNFSANSQAFFCHLDGVVWDIVFFDSDSQENQFLSLTEFSMCIFFHFTSLKEKGLTFSESQSSSSFLLCETKKPLKNNILAFSSLPMKAIQSERQQTAAPWDFVLTGQLTNPYSPARLSKCYLLFLCVDKELGSTAAGATGGESIQGLSEGAWQYFWQGQEQMRW